jgi:hypothetical protein
MEQNGPKLSKNGASTDAAVRAELHRHGGLGRVRTKPRTHPNLNRTLKKYFAAGQTGQLGKEGILILVLGLDARSRLIGVSGYCANQGF